MRYHEAVEYLLALRRFRVRPGTASTAALLEQCGRPDDDLAVVQVAGSNGKGSTARMLESVLREAGLSVGLYTSPHLHELRDRIRVDGRPVSKRRIATFVGAMEDHIDERAATGDPPTFFEVLTALSLWTFEKEGCDVAVLEVGIGGRHDATSATTPIASAVTSVTTEHTDVLGETIPEIATDKAAVATGDRPLVTGATGEALAAIRSTTDVFTVGDSDDVDLRTTYQGVRDRIEAAVAIDAPSFSVETRLPLPGAHQARNAGVATALAQQVADTLEFDLAPRTIADGLRSAHWPGRFEVVETEPLVVLDGAHNRAACAAVADTLAEYSYDDLTLVVGAMNDKDHTGMAAALPPADRVLISRPAIDRAEARPVLARVYEAADHHSEIEDVGAVETALERALEASGTDDCVLVTGSLYTVAEARTRWSNYSVPKAVPDLSAARALLEGAGVAEPGVYRMRGKTVHRVFRTQLRSRQAQYLKEEMLSLGGECAVSAAGDGAHEPVAVVCAGTLAQFKRLTEKLQGQPYGLDVVGNRIRRELGIQVESVDSDWPWADGPSIMGILNVTPDSFHDGGEYESVQAAVKRAERMTAAGADIIDIGGESTNPAADPTPAEKERKRVLPVIEALAERDLDAMLSIDTRKARVARSALDAGAEMINDVSGLQDPAMRFVAADYDAPTVVMHSLDAPVVPEHTVEYDDVVEDVIRSLREQVRLAEQAGLDRERILVDPGLGFGKSAEESWTLLSRLGEFRALGCPIMIGHSHKSMFGAIDRYPDEGGYGTVAATALAANRGADVIRVHDVPENLAAVQAASMVGDTRLGGGM